MNIPKKKHILRKHNHTRNDPFFWLHKKNKKVMNIIDTSNQQTNDFFDDTKSLQKQLIQEFKNRTFEYDKSIPTQYKHYYYHTIIKKNENYGRSFISKTKNDKGYCFFNPEKLSQKHTHFQLGPLIISYNETLLLYSVDYTGDLKYNLYCKNIFSNKITKELPFEISNSYLFHPNNLSFYYIKYDTKIRPYQIWYHIIGDNVTNDILIYEEKNPEYWLDLSLSTDEKYIFIHSEAYENNHVTYIKDNIHVIDILPKKKNMNIQLITIKINSISYQIKIKKKIFNYIHPLI